MRAIRMILLAVLAIFGCAALYVMTQPSEYKVVRSRTIPASASATFSQMTDFKKFVEWNPWSKLDPKQTINYKGEANAVGHGYAWKGNDMVGEGEMVIKEIVPNQKVVYELTFLQPHASTSPTYFSLNGGEKEVKVDWVMEGKYGGFVEKFFMTMMGGMDKMIGKDFEKGLENLEKAAIDADKAMKDSIAAPTANPTATTQTK